MRMEAVVELARVVERVLVSPRSVKEPMLPKTVLLTPSSLLLEVLVAVAEVTTIDVEDDTNIVELLLGWGAGREVGASVLVSSGGGRCMVVQMVGL